MRSYMKGLVVTVSLTLAMSVAGAQGKPPAGQKGQPTRPTTGAQQQGQQAQPSMQRQADRMQQMSQRMEQIRERARQMNQTCTEELAKGEQVQNRTEAQEQHMAALRQMQQLSDAIGQSAQQLGAAADRTREMLQQREMIRTREQRRDMDRLQQHLNETAEHLDEAVRVMDRLHDRLQTSTSAPK